MLGTGVTYIKCAYANAKIKPKFVITDNIISVILPVINDKYNVLEAKEKIIKALENGAQLSSSEFAKASRGYNVQNIENS